MHRTQHEEKIKLVLLKCLVFKNNINYCYYHFYSQQNNTRYFHISFLLIQSEAHNIVIITLIFITVIFGVISVIFESDLTV